MNQNQQIKVIQEAVNEHDSDIQMNTYMITFYW